MNYCTKCASYYQNPGTCNCYAPTQITWPYQLTWCPCKTTGICNCWNSGTVTWGTSGGTHWNGPQTCDSFTITVKKDEPPETGTPCEGPHGEDA